MPRSTADTTCNLPKMTLLAKKAAKRHMLLDTTCLPCKALPSTRRIWRPLSRKHYGKRICVPDAGRLDAAVKSPCMGPFKAGTAPKAPWHGCSRSCGYLWLIPSQQCPPSQACAGHFTCVNIRSGLGSFLPKRVFGPFGPSHHIWSQNSLFSSFWAPLGDHPKPKQTQSGLKRSVLESQVV